MKENHLSAKIRNRNIIMHEAKKLFEAKGLDNVTVIEIADASKMCRATVFNHFKSIDDLLITLGEQEIEDIVQYCKGLEVVGLPHIRAMFHKLIEDTAYYPNLVTRLTNKMILSDKKDNSVALIEQLVIRQLNLCSPDMLVCGLSLTNCATMIMGLYLGLITHYHTHNLPFNIVEMCNKFDLMLSALFSEEKL